MHLHERGLGTMLKKHCTTARWKPLLNVSSSNTDYTDVETRRIFLAFWNWLYSRRVRCGLDPVNSSGCSERWWNACCIWSKGSCKRSSMRCLYILRRRLWQVQEDFFCILVFPTLNVRRCLGFLPYE